MCGRYTLTNPVAATRALFGLDPPEGTAARWNIAPTQSALVAFADATDGGLRLVPMRWGFAPPDRAEGAKRGPDPINARAESAHARPMFREAFRERRCAVPASGFLEWTSGPGRSKQPHHIVMADGAPFAMAGLWTPWRDVEGVRVGCFTVITTSANDTVAPLHDRMPAILAPADVLVWLDPTIHDVERLAPLLRPYDAAPMAHHAVDPRLNSPAFDAPEGLEPVDPLTQGELF
jgi:putative SOS response-associated peptidase YedK